MKNSLDIFRIIATLEVEAKSFDFGVYSRVYREASPDGREIVNLYNLQIKAENETLATLAWMYDGVMVWTFPDHTSARVRVRDKATLRHDFRRMLKARGFRRLK